MKDLKTGFMFAIGWTLGRIVVHEALDYGVQEYKKSKLYKEITCKSKKDENIDSRPYHGTRMGFQP